MQNWGGRQFRPTTECKVYKKKIVTTMVLQLSTSPHQKI